MNIKKTLFAIVTVLFAIQFCYAYGVSSSFYGQNSLDIYPDEQKNITLTLQNMVGNENITFEAEIFEGEDIASLIGKSNKYLVPLGRKDIPVDINVKIPKEYETGNYKIGVSFKQATENNQGVNIGLGIKEFIPVKVIKNPDEKWQTFPIMIGIILLFIFAILIISLIILKNFCRKL